MSLDGDFAGPAMGFEYTVSGALLIQVYGIFCHSSGIKYFVLPAWILGIQFIDMN